MRPQATSSTLNLMNALTELGLGTFRALHGRFHGETWSRRESEPSGRWVERLRDELAMRTPSDDDIKRVKAMTAKALEEKYGSGLKMGGMVKKGRDGIAQRGKTKGRMC